MIRTLTLGCALALAALLPASAAEAKRGGIDIVQEQLLLPVAPAPGTQNGWICHLVNRTSLAFIPLWTSSDSYVYGATNCEGGQYASIPEPVPTLQAAGAFPADLPPKPRFTALQVAEGFAGSILALGVLGLLGLIYAGRARRRDIRLKILGIGDGPIFQMVDLMCHAALADGKTDPSEVAFIRNLARDLTGLDFQDLHITEMIDRADRLSKPKDFVQFARGLNMEQRMTVLNGALSVILADGSLAPSEEAFLKNLIVGMRLPGQDVVSAVQDTLSRREGAVPA